MQKSRTLRGFPVYRKLVPSHFSFRLEFVPFRLPDHDRAISGVSLSELALNSRMELSIGLVEAAAMRVAVAGGEVLEPAERGAPAGAGTERRGHLAQRGNGLVAEQGNDRVGGELGWSHCDTIAVSSFR